MTNSFLCTSNFFETNFSVLVIYVHFCCFATGQVAPSFPAFSTVLLGSGYCLTWVRYYFIMLLESGPSEPLYMSWPPLFISRSCNWPNWIWNSEWSFCSAYTYLYKRKTSLSCSSLIVFYFRLRLHFTTLCILLYTCPIYLLFKFVKNHVCFSCALTPLQH